MPTQRSVGDAGGDSGPTRRRLLAALGTAVAGAGGAGCLSPLTGSADASPVSVLVAGSLQRSFGEGLESATDVPTRVEARGSVTAARLVASGRRDPDVLALADPALFDRLLDAWHAEFAANALVVAYVGMPAGRRVADASPWFEPVLDGRATLGRTDPDLDPLGYRTRFAADLAADHYDRPDLGDRLFSPDQVYPETSLVSRPEAGEVDAAVVYRSMAVERGYDYLELPPAVDLSDPSRADRYATADYELPDGTVVRGAPISYAVRARRRGDRVAAVYESILEGSFLDEYGFETPEAYPRYRGSVPDALRV